MKGDHIGDAKGPVTLLQVRPTRNASVGHVTSTRMNGGHCGNEKGPVTLLQERASRNAGMGHVAMKRITRTRTGNAKGPDLGPCKNALLAMLVRATWPPEGKGQVLPDAVAPSFTTDAVHHHAH